MDGPSPHSRKYPRLSRRAVLGGLAGIPAAAALGACSPGTSSAGAGPANGAGITIQDLVGTLPASDVGGNKYQAQIAQKFKTKTGAKINYVGWADQNGELTKIESVFATHTGGDMFFGGNTVAAIGLYNGGFRKLTDSDWTKIGGKERFFTNNLKLLGPNLNDLIAVPAHIFPYQLVYNTDLFKRAHIKNPPETWEEFIADAKAIGKLGTGIHGAALEPVGDTSNVLWKIIYMLTREYNGEFISADGKTATLSSDAVYNATQFYFDWFTKYGIAPVESLTWTDTMAVGAFADGRLGMMPMQGPGVITGFQGATIGNNYAFAPFPQDPPGSTTHVDVPAYTLDNCYAIFNSTTNLDLTLELINLSTSFENQLLFNKLEGVYPGNKEAAAEVAKKDPVIHAFQSVIDKSIGSPLTPVWANVEAIVPTVTQRLGAALKANNYNTDLLHSTWSSGNSILQNSIQKNVIQEAK